MPQFRRLIRVWFGLEALGLLLNILYLCVSIAKGRIEATLSHLIVTMLGLLLFNLMPALAWWTLKQGKTSGRAWAMIASASNVAACILIFSRNTGHLPMIVIIGIGLGIGGLVAFGSSGSGLQARAPRKARSAGDGTGKFKDFSAQGASIVIIWLAYRWWMQWAAFHHLPTPGVLRYFSEFLIAVIVATVCHESGHAIAGWASGKILCSFQIGPLRWALRHGIWRFSFQPRRFFGGAVGMVAPDLINLRSRKAVAILGGPVASLMISSVCTVATLTALGHAWQPYWNLLSMIASVSIADCIVNLIPLKPESSYSDGAQLYQVVANGPWARVHTAFAMITTSAVSPVRPRDFDVNMLNEAADFVPHGERGLLLRLYAYHHYVDKGRVSEALVKMQDAERLYDECKFERPQDICVEFAFANAFYKFDLPAAELWWQRIEALGKIDPDADYYRAKAALLSLKGERPAAREAWQTGSELAAKLPSAGLYEYKRSCFAKLRHGLELPGRTARSRVSSVFREWPERRAAAVKG